jgi:hypothetical protein
MKELGFSRHYAASTPRIFDSKTSVNAAIKFINDVQPKLNAVGDLSRVVAIDQN